PNATSTTSGSSVQFVEQPRRAVSEATGRPRRHGRTGSWGEGPKAAVESRGRLKNERKEAETNGGLQATEEQKLVVQVHLERRTDPREHEANEQASGRADGGGAQNRACEG